jgi:hypothetical protein
MIDQNDPVNPSARARSAGPPPSNPPRSDDPFRPVLGPRGCRMPYIEKDGALYQFGGSGTIKLSNFRARIAGARPRNQYSRA